MVDPDAPDLARYPRFADALAMPRSPSLVRAMRSSCPPLWWHHVRAFGRLNVLVNYWWGHEFGRGVPGAGPRDLGGARFAAGREGRAGASWFDHLVFDADAARAADHLPAPRAACSAPASRRAPNASAPS